MGIIDKEYNILYINKFTRYSIGFPTEVKTKLHKRNKLLFESNDSLLYRDLVFDSERHSPIKSGDLNKALNITTLVES